MQKVFLFVVTVFLCAAHAAHGQIKSTQHEQKISYKPYGSVEMRHHLSTYYDQQGYYHHQEPSTHLRLQLGSEFYNGKLDLYTTLGIYKRPQTQQIQQRQAELALDFRPIRGEYGSVLIYNILQFPANSVDPIDEDDRGPSGEGTVYILGLSPKFELRALTQTPRLDLNVGFDGWTKMYSRKQYALAEGETMVEDVALHYKVQAFLGAKFSVPSIRSLSMDLSAHYQSDFTPIYVQEDESQSYHYGAKRYSFYKARLTWDINDRVSLANDFYHYFSGAFAAKRDGDDRRFRNIARLTCKL